MDGDEVISNKNIEDMQNTIDMLVDAYNTTSVLEDVLTFSEASALIGKASNYFTELVKRGKLVDGKDYRMSGRIGLIRKDVALTFK